MLVDLTNFYLCVNEKFWDFIDNKSRVRLSYGGAGSSKSFSAFQDIIYKLITEPGHNFLILRKVHSSNKTSTFALIQQVISEMEVSHLFKINKSDMTVTVKATGYQAVFKGLDDVEKVKSITFPMGVLTDIVVEEASEITKKDFDQLLARLRGMFSTKIPKSYKIDRIEDPKIPFQITLLLNPISNKHWIKREFIDLKSYQKSMSVYILHSTYKDNEFIDPDYKDILEGYKETDRFFYDVHCLGEWGAVGNVIFNNWELRKCPYKEEDFDAVYIGMDFGSVHPSVIEKIGMKDGILYSYDELCVFDKTNMEFINENREYDVLDVGQRCKADSAEPARIKEWVQQGFSVIPAKKGPDSVTRGIDYIKNFKWYIDPDRCPRLAQEVEVYHWKEDKNGDPIEGKPVEIFDDGIKSVIYALEDLSRSQGKPQVLSGTKTDQKKKILDIKKEERKKIREVKKAQAKKRREEKK